jgi:hypothetical protein
MRRLMERAKRKHNMLWVSLVWMEPWGQSTWCVWGHPHGGKDTELARSTSLWVALWRASR